MGVIASGPPFVNRELCECGWMWQDECKKLEKCGLNQGMPEYNREEVLSEEWGSVPDYVVSPHTPFEFVSGAHVATGCECSPVAHIDLNKVCREVVEDLVKDSKSTQVGGTHYAEMAVQPWEAMRAWMSPAEYTAYHVGTVIGYLSRHKKKGGLTDIKKAKHHLEELVRYFEEEEEYSW